MEIIVPFYDDVRLFAAAAEGFLLSRAVLTDLVLAIVDGAGGAATLRACDPAR
jgi:hypothetical protein